MNIQVDLLNVTPLKIVVGAIRQCYESFENSDSGCKDNDGMVSSNLPYKLGPKDKALVERIIDHGHTSTLEHIVFNFQIKGISRLNLQELARHRIASPSVKSTRYTLKELKNESAFDMSEDSFIRASKYINFIEIDEIDRASLQALENVRILIKSGKYSNDKIKYCLPECYRTDLYWSVNVRSLQNFLTLRTSDQAHFEIRELANKIYDKIPADYKFLFKV